MLFGWAAVGLVVGVLLDLAIRRLTLAREDIAHTLCPVCDVPAFDRRVVPIFGALFAAPCPRCSRNGWQPRLAIQLATAAAFAALAWRLPLGAPLLVYSLYVGIWLVVFVTDLRYRLILNVVTYPGMLLAILLSGLAFDEGLLDGALRAGLGGLFAGGVFLLLYVLALVLYRRDDALCLGDVKLAFLIGLMTGWPAAVVAILLGTFMGAIIGFSIMLRERSAKATMPYGPALTLGALASLLWHPPA